MTTIEYRHSDGRPWHDQLSLGQTVMVERISNEDYGARSINRAPAKITSIGATTLVTDKGEIFDKQTARAVDFANPTSQVSLQPTIADQMRLKLDIHIIPGPNDDPDEIRRMVRGEEESF